MSAKPKHDKLELPTSKFLELCWLGFSVEASLLKDDCFNHSSRDWLSPGPLPSPRAEGGAESSCPRITWQPEPLPKRLFFSVNPGVVEGGSAFTPHRLGATRVLGALQNQDWRTKPVLLIYCITVSISHSLEKSSCLHFVSKNIASTAGLSSGNSSTRSSCCLWLLLALTLAVFSLHVACLCLIAGHWAAFRPGVLSPSAEDCVWIPSGT